MNEKDVLVSHLSDKLRYCRERDCIQSTHFLDAASLSEAKRFCAAEKRVRYSSADMKMPKELYALLYPIFIPMRCFRHTSSMEAKISP